MAFNFIKAVLVELGKADDVAKKELGFKTWSETNQKSDRNNPYIYQAVLKVVKQKGLDVGEFKNGNSKSPSN